MFGNNFINSYFESDDKDTLFFLKKSPLLETDIKVFMSEMI